MLEILDGKDVGEGTSVTVGGATVIGGIGLGVDVASTTTGVTVFVSATVTSVGVGDALHAASKNVSESRVIFFI